MKRLFLSVVVSAFAATMLSLPGAKAAVFTVNAIDDMAHWLDTGISLDAGTTYNFAVVDPGTIWSAGGPPNRDSTADGIDPVFYPAQTVIFNGFTGSFKFGALVGLDDAGFFLIGTGPVALTGLSGELKVGYWDTIYTDNNGSQTLAVDAVPEPSTWAMMMLGFAGLGFMTYRKRKNGLALTA
jgi:hypothetical protein